MFDNTPDKENEIPEEIKKQWKDRILYLDRIDPKKIKLNPLNPKDHPQRQKEVMEGILNDIGWTDTITINVTTGNLVDGEMRVLEALDKNEEFVPVIYVELSEEEEKKMLITFNQVSYLAKERSDRIKQIYESVKSRNEDLQSFMDKTANRNGMLVGDKLKKVVEDVNSVNIKINEFDVQVGQLWSIQSKNSRFKHRLVCGDSKDRNLVDKLFEMDKASLFATDPPYGNNASGKSFVDIRDGVEAIESDNFVGENLEKFLYDIFSVWFDYLNKDFALYIWHASDGQSNFENVLKKLNVLISKQIIWNKSKFVFNPHNHYHFKHEPCFYGWLKGNMPEFYGDRNQSTVWDIEYDESRSKIGHPTAKPIKCFSIPISNSTKIEQICAEPFAGSGSQYIAAEQLGRVVYGMEKNLNYCSLILSRLKNFGLEPILEG